MDIIIPISVNDADNIIKNREYFIKNLNSKKIIVIGNEEVGIKVKSIAEIDFINENNLYNGLTFQNVKSIIYDINPKAVRRTGWYLQQFLKMAYAFVCNDHCYLVWDSDTIPLKNITFINREGKYLYALKNGFHEPYFDTMKKILPTIHKINNKGSFITEHMIFDVQIMKTMIKEIESNVTIKGASFFEKILRSISQKDLILSGFSEFETYGNYMMNFYPEKYTYRQLKPMRHGKIYFGSNPNEKKLNWASNSFDTISFEHFDREWKIFSFLTSLLVKKQIISMAAWDKKAGKIIRFYHKFRRVVKDLLNK